jgi:general secretion pathway protein D
MRLHLTIAGIVAAFASCVLTAAEKVADTANPMVATDELASRLAERFAASSLAVSSLVVGADGEGVALVKNGERMVLARKGSVIDGEVDGIKVRSSVRSVSAEGIEIAGAGGGIMLRGRYTPLAAEGETPKAFIRYLEADSVRLGELIKLISDRTGVNISSSDAAAVKPVSVFLRNITVVAAVEEICRSTGLWFRSDSQVVRVMTMEEFQRNLASFREETTESFTLLYPNVVEVAGVIYGLYPDRTLLSLGEQELQEDAENELSRRFRRFRVLEENGGSQFMDMEAPSVSSGAAGTGSGAFSFSRGSALSRLTQWEQLRLRRRANALQRKDELSQAEAKEIGKALAEGDRDGYEKMLGESRSAANIFVSMSRKNNMLIVRTSDTRAMEEIRQLVKRMDVPTPMVLLELKIMELRLDDDYAAKFEYDLHVKENTHTVGNNGSLAADILQPALAGVNPTFSFKVLNDDISAKIDLMQKDGRAKVLATPTLLTANNEVSRIFSGKELPIVTGWTPGETITQGDGPLFTSQPTPEIERKDVGTMLLVTPNINADRTVTLHIMQENSSTDENMVTTIPVPGYSNLSVQYVESRSLTGTFVAKDKMTVMAGGLIKESESEVFYRTPFFGSIPLLGWLFRGTEKQKLRTELVVLITPHVISTPYEGGKISEELIRALSAHPSRDGAKSMGTLRKPSDGSAAEHTIKDDGINVFK